MRYLRCEIILNLFAYWICGYVISKSLVCDFPFFYFYLIFVISMYRHLIKWNCITFNVQYICYRKVNSTNFGVCILKMDTAILFLSHALAVIWLSRWLSLLFDEQSFAKIDVWDIYYWNFHWLSDWEQTTKQF